MENIFMGPVFVLVWLALVVFMIVSMWKVYTKAGQAGWKCLIPVYNIVILCRIVGLSGWWVLVLFVPVANIILSVYISYLLAKTFGKGIGFAIGLALLGFIFYPILAFGNTVYTKPATLSTL